MLVSKLTLGSVPDDEACGGQAQAPQRQLEDALVVQQGGVEGGVADVGDARGLEGRGGVAHGGLPLHTAGVEPDLFVWAVSEALMSEQRHGCVAA